MNEPKRSGWQVWVDTGGTFTDCVAVDAAGKIHRKKVLSSSALRGSVEEVIDSRTLRVSVAWEVPTDFIHGFRFCPLGERHVEVRVGTYDDSGHVIVLDQPLPVEVLPGTAFEVRSPEEAPVLAARLATGTPMGSPLPEISMRLATTIGTNTLLERTGTPIALFVTRGFQDLLRIGNQQRPELFVLDIRRPEPLYHSVVEVGERMASDGAVLMPLEPGFLSHDISRLTSAGVRHAAVALMHSYAHPKHERELAAYLLENGFHHVSCSSDLAPFIKILPRAETAVIDAYLAPIIGDYLGRVRGALPGGHLHVMTSAGGMTQSHIYPAKDSLLSGPAGGVGGAVAAGRRSGLSRIIAFDMGGTSTDVARYDGDYDYVFEHEVGDAHLVGPALAIETVSAGGGSICRFDGMELTVGPDSAGADPGPACYGAGGPLTLTDVNLLLGRLDGSRFDIPIDVDAAERAFEELLHSVEEKESKTIERERMLEGLVQIADERMADTIRRISIRKGYDPRDYALVAFGGAGAQHACGVAAHLGIETIVVPTDASLLSAWGLGNAAFERFAERQVLQPLSEAGNHLSQWIRELSREATDTLQREGTGTGDVDIHRILVNLRLVGQDSGLQIEYDEESPLEETFESKYRTVFGYWPEGRAIELESIRVVASTRREDIFSSDKICGEITDSSRPGAKRDIRAWFDGEWCSVPVLQRSDLDRGTRIRGPALIIERHTVTTVENGWAARVDEVGALVLGRTRAPNATRTHPQVVRLELFTHRFGSIAREMGEMLQRTAISTNVKERLDFSCAVLDAQGALIVNAPHIPVHLGAIGMCVRETEKTLPMEAGDVVVTNHPKYGGSHLPDVTVITPVDLPDGRRLGYVANRAHHAEIGGNRPGSMPPDATRLVEEGVVIPPTYLFKRGEPCWDVVRRLFLEAPFPTRAVEENLADLRAAVAANRSGARAFLKLAQEHGTETVHHYMAAIKQRAAARIRAALGRIPDGTYEATEHLDDGSPLHVKIDIAGEQAHIDFAGCAGVHPGNLNATAAVVNSVIIFVMRLLVREALPLNEGLMHALTVNLPTGLLNPDFPQDPSRAPAVVGGNVETSQRLVDTLMKALGLAACSQGTMNNVLFGTDSYSYYETVCGGTGAGPGFDGTSAVHSHMTNTRITDPEILEHRHPVRLERFAVRHNSGGRGVHHGGDGVIREISFWQEMSLSVLGQHRTTGPYGLEGGDAGKPASQVVVRANGDTVHLDAIDGCEVSPGDRLVLKTPGGGGYGARKRTD